MRAMPRLAKLGAKLLLWYLFLTALLFWVQRSVMYQPRTLTSEQFVEQVRTRLPGATVLAPFDAIVVEPAGPPSKTAILFHGNGGSGIHRSMLAPEFLSRGYRLVLAEYPGYAARPGQPEEGTIIPDALALFQAIKQKFPQQPLVLVGESLGTAVATQVAARYSQNVQSLVLITPFTSMSDVAAREFVVFPARYLVLDSFESFQHIQGYAGPIHMLVADKDELVSAESGLALHAIAETRGETSLLRLPEAGHNSWMFQMTATHWDALLGSSAR